MPSILAAVCLWLLVSAAAQAQVVWDAVPETTWDPAPVATEEFGAFQIFPDWHITDFAAAPTVPHFTFTVDVPVLTRTKAGPQAFVFDENNGATLLDAGNIGLSTEGAIRLDLIFYDESGWDLEFAYLGTEDFSARVWREDPNLDFRFFNARPAEPIDRYAFDYESNLHSGEFNLRRRCGPHVALLAGARGLQIHERFDILNGRAQNTGFFSRTYNHLWGVQLGGDARWWLNGVFALTATLKAGIYKNNVEVYASALDAANDDVLEMRFTSSETAFFGEAWLGVLVSMGHHAAFRLGYVVFLTEGIALAPDQSPNLHLFTGQGQVALGQPVYQGGWAGFEISF
jgi:hypothetical protein